MERKVITLEKVELFYTRQQELPEELMYNLVWGLLSYCSLDLNTSSALQELNESKNKYLSFDFCSFYQGIKEQLIDRHNIQKKKNTKKNYARPFIPLFSYATDYIIELIKKELRARQAAKELLANIKFR